MIKFMDIKTINKKYEDELKQSFTSFLDDGTYILGKQVQKFENAFANYCGTKFCIGVSNGLDALTLIFKSYIALGRLRLGDQVLVPANTYIASIIAIINSGLKPVLIEPSLTTYNIDINEVQNNISKKVRAILVVHLYGQLANMEALQEISRVNNLLIIEDAAQAHGAMDSKLNKKAGNLGHAAAFSFYPTKNIGAFGDAGAINTNDQELAEMIGLFRNYGREGRDTNIVIGRNNRLDELQASFLNVKLKYIEIENDRRRQIAHRYLTEIKNKKLILPYWDKSKNHVFYAFVIRTNNRNNLKAFLNDNGIETLIFYPIAPHKQKALKDWNHLSYPITESIHNDILSVPLNSAITNEQVLEIIDILNKY